MGGGGTLKFDSFSRRILLSTRSKALEKSIMQDLMELPGVSSATNQAILDMSVLVVV
jgi:hypothetical protein